MDERLPLLFRAAGMSKAGMIRRRLTTRRVARLVTTLVLASIITDRCSADETQRPLTAAVGHHPIARTGNRNNKSAEVTSSNGFWISALGIGLVFAVFGGLSLAVKRFWPERNSTALRVLGRVVLSSRHSAYLLQAGDRVLIIGVGNSGPPALLGELPWASGSSAESVPTVAALIGDGL